MLASSFDVFVLPWLGSHTYHHTYQSLGSALIGVSRLVVGGCVGSALTVVVKSNETVPFWN